MLPSSVTSFINGCQQLECGWGLAPPSQAVNTPTAAPDSPLWGQQVSLTPEKKRNVQQLPARNRWSMATITAQLVAEEMWKTGKMKKASPACVCGAGVSVPHTHTR